MSELNETVEQAITCACAVGERDVVVNRNQAFLPYCGLWQSYFTLLQSELEYLAPLYVNHATGPLNAGKTGFLYFSLLTWRTAAGLNASGFLRSTDGITFYFGQMQAGDIIGSWIFEDLQKGFGALKWTLWGSYSTVYEQKNTDAGPPNYGQGYDDAVATWNAGGWWGPPYFSSFYEVYASKSSSPSSPVYWAMRKRSLVTLNSLPEINRSMDVYVQVTGPAGGYCFLDFDSTGAGLGQFFLEQEVPIFSGATKLLDYIGDISTCPLVVGEMESKAGGVGYQFECDNIGLLIKWNFTN